MSARMAFGLAVVAAVIMLAIGSIMGVAAPSCRPVPMSVLTAFELVRSDADLVRLFGAPGDACRAPLVEQLDRANIIDSIGYIAAYTAFYALVLFALGRRDKALGNIGIALAIACALADFVENAAMFQLSAAPDDASTPWLPALVIATNIKWVGLAVVTTLAGVMLWRLGGWRRVVLPLAAAPLVPSIWAVIDPDAAGRYLIPGMVIASVPLLAVAIIGALGRLTRA